MRHLIPALEPFQIPPNTSEGLVLGCDLVLENKDKENGPCQVFFYQEQTHFQITGSSSVSSSADPQRRVTGWILVLPSGFHVLWKQWQWPRLVWLLGLTLSFVYIRVTVCLMALGQKQVVF